MGDGFVESRVVGVAGVDDFAGRAAGHGVGVGSEVESALGLVGVVAVEAAVFENGADVVLVGDLVVGCLGGGGGGGR